mmetsp:Transcript_4049/g.13300  ORF Transcript_4049/g.13300 Transcript_4049/m.13300 type:complete len:210 (-) Transcript_4049:420-1049(-)
MRKPPQRPTTRPWPTARRRRRASPSSARSSSNWSSPTTAPPNRPGANGASGTSSLLSHTGRPTERPTDQATSDPRGAGRVVADRHAPRTDPFPHAQRQARSEPRHPREARRHEPPTGVHDDCDHLLDLPPPRQDARRSKRPLRLRRAALPGTARAYVRRRDPGEGQDSRRRRPRREWRRQADDTRRGHRGAGATEGGTCGGVGDDDGRQ